MRRSLPRTRTGVGRTGVSRARRVGIPLATLVALLAVWEAVVDTGLVPNFMLPSPVQVVLALVGDVSLLASHVATTLVEAAPEFGS